jgi:septal ring-binding cell division protein DamX
MEMTLDEFALTDPPTSNGGGVRMSPTIGKLAEALVKAQAEMEGAAKDATNPHYRSKYADLASIRDASRPTAKYGIAILQPTRAEGPHVTVTTMLIHTSGEWISEELTLTAGQNTPQAVGSAITYGRRYGLAAMVGIAPEDDDGEAAEPRNATALVTPAPKPPAKPAKPTAPVKFDSWLAGLALVAEDGIDALLEAWRKSGRDLKEYADAKHRDELEALKARARAVGKPAPVEEAPF